jgi:hypothetical protein
MTGAAGTNTNAPPAGGKGGQDPNRDATPNLHNRQYTKSQQSKVNTAVKGRTHVKDSAYPPKDPKHDPFAAKRKEGKP